MAEKCIFHVDVNSAFLSWEAAYRMQVLGDSFDLRAVPSVVAGERVSRHSIILAKSLPAKKYGIKTGEPLGMAREKCPELVVVKPNYGLYVDASRKLIALLREFSPKVDQFSIDEAWVDMTGTARLFGAPTLAAKTMKDRIRDELGFTVNIGISENKLLAKVAGDFEKPDKIHTLYPSEIPEKLWVLPVRDLFTVGRATERKLHELGIRTVGQLAHADRAMLRKKLYKQGDVLWHFANGRCDDALLAPPQENKGYGNTMTTPWNVTKPDEGRQVLLSLCETVGMRLRRDGKRAELIALSLRTEDFHDYSRQMPLSSATNGTEELYRAACRLFEASWDQKTPLRLLGVRVGKVTADDYRQQSLFDDADFARQEKRDAAVDEIRAKYGEDVIQRAVFLRGGIAKNMAGGLSKNRRTGVTKPVPEEGKE